MNKKIERSCAAKLLRSKIMMLVKSGTNPNPKAKLLRFFFSLWLVALRASYLLKEFIILKGIHEG